MAIPETTTEPQPFRAVATGTGRTFTRLILRLGAWIRWSLLFGSGLLACVIIYHSVCLWNLPDIGEPFDSKPLTEHRVADDANAFVAYLQAVGKLGPSMSLALHQDFQTIRRKDWADPSEALSSWIDGNRSALELWRVGSERSGGEPPASLVMDGVYMVNGHEFLHRLNEFTLMALIEAARLRREGDLAKAWTYCRAILRTGRHQQRHGSSFARARGLSTLAFFRDAAKAWVDDPRVSDKELRQALDDLDDADSLLVPNAEAIEVGYLQELQRLKDPNYLKNLRLSPDSTIIGWQNDQIWYRYLPFWHEGSLYLWNEPERSRRILKLETANWLIAAAPSELSRTDLREAYPHVFTPLPLATLNQGVLPPWIDDWFRSSLLFEAGRPSDPYKGHWKENDQSKVNPLKVEIAKKLFEKQYHREPESAKELVGPFLKSWPEGVPEP